MTRSLRLCSLAFLLLTLAAGNGLVRAESVGGGAPAASASERMSGPVPEGSGADLLRRTPVIPATPLRSVLRSAQNSTKTPAPPPAEPFVAFGNYRLPVAASTDRKLLTMEWPEGRLQLTRAQLMALPPATLVTRHAQLGRTFKYQGVLLKTLAAAMHSTGKDLRIYASNGFVATIAAEDYLKAPIMLAYAANGKPISILDKGPLTTVLPDNDRRFQFRPDYWVWFVDRITPVPSR